MTPLWEEWYLKHDPFLFHFTIRRNESATYWQLHGNGMLLMNCLTWDQAVDTFYAIMRTEDPQAPCSRQLFPTGVRII